MVVSKKELILEGRSPTTRLAGRYAFSRRAVGLAPRGSRRQAAGVEICELRSGS